MEITELRCTACNGTLQLDDEENPNIAVCEYCQAVYMIHKGTDEGVDLKPENSEDMKCQRSDRWYKPVVEKTETRGYYNWTRGIIVTIVVLIIIIASRWDALVKRYQGKDEAIVTESVEVEEKVANVQVMEQKIFKGIFADMAATVLQKPVDEIKTEDLACFKWIEMKYTTDAIWVGYSFEMADGANKDLLEWVSFPRDAAVQDFKVLSNFTGLKKLEVAGYLSAEAVEGLQLESLTCYARSPMEIARIMDTSTLKELNISGGLESLEGISQFENLEKLSVYCYELKDIKELVNQTRLKSLTIESGDEINDFTVLSLMTGLEELSIESENIRDISFIKTLTNLKSFALSDAPVLQVGILDQLNGLTSLAIEDCDELKDLSVLEGLTELKSLVLEVPYHCPSPDLSALSKLSRLSLSGAAHINFLRNMTALQELSLDGCKIEDTEVFTYLTGLKTLKCSSILGEISGWRFVTKIPSLQSLDLSGISTYEDISCVFGIPTLQKLALNGAECEIDFSNIKENTTLKVLNMDGVKLYKNVQVSGSNGFYAVDYDHVSLDENIDFLKHFPGITDLSLADNTLTHIDFVKALHSLKTLDISENYITDLKALESLGSLQNVNCTGNPIENYRVLNDKVIVIH